MMDVDDTSAADGSGVAERWTSTVVLGDGDTAVIRPITPGDAPALAEFHARQSPESRYRRFFSPKPTLSNDELERFTTVDFVDRVALVVEAHETFIGWASYERWQHREDAEVAFMVDDELHGKGIATLLLEHLAAIATSNGVTEFTAQTLGDNRSMLTVFAKAGWPVHRRFESGVIDVDFPLADTSEFIDSVERREQRADSKAVARLLLPSSIAVLGASDTAGTVGRAVWRHVAADRGRPVYPVNPAHEVVGGVTSYPSVADVPGDVGLAIIAVPADALTEAIDACIEHRVRGAVVVTATDGSDLDVGALVSRARRNGLRIIGPASMGIASPLPLSSIQAALVDVALPPGRVAISLQSGTIGGSLLRLAGQLSLGISWFVSLGDKSDVSANDLLQFWEDDEATSVIALYTESLGNPRKFGRIARRVSTRRPIVVVRTGAALVGTGNEALYRQTGVIEVPTVTALLDTARVFASQPLMAGTRVAIVSNASSPTVFAAATLEAAGLDVVDPPVRLDWRSPSDDYRGAIRAALDAPDIDALLVIHAPPVQGAVGDAAPVIDETCRGAHKPVVAVMLGAGDGPVLPGSDVPSFTFPEQAAATLGRVAAYSTWRRTEGHEPDEQVPDLINAPVVDRLVQEHLPDGSMPPESLRSVLAAYGVDMAATRRCDAADAAAVADELGYPVAVKASTRHVGRSVEAGIALDLNDADDVDGAIATMRTHLGDDAADVYVQQMVPPGVDLRIRAHLDDRLGPVVTTGLGGLQADLIADEASRLVPISTSSARAMIADTRAAGALDDGAVERFAPVLTRVAQLMSDHPAIAELDLNPVVVSDDACVVVDAAIVLRPSEHVERAVRRLD